MGDLSEAALDVLARWFAMSPRDTMRSHPPHATLSAIRPAMTELVAAGLITEEPFNRHGSILFTGSAQAHEIGSKRLGEKIAALWASWSEPAQGDQP